MKTFLLAAMISTSVFAGVKETSVIISVECKYSWSNLTFGFETKPKTNIAQLCANREALVKHMIDTPKVDAPLRLDRKAFTKEQWERLPLYDY